MHVSATNFKARCLKLMDEVQAKRKEIVITKHGKPVAKLVPADRKRQPLHGHLKGTIRILGDIVGPFPEEWQRRR